MFTKLFPLLSTFNIDFKVSFLKEDKVKVIIIFKTKTEDSQSIAPIVVIGNPLEIDETLIDTILDQINGLNVVEYAQQVNALSDNLKLISKQKEKAIADANKKKTTTTAKKKPTTTATKKVEPKVEEKTDLFATNKEEVKPKTVTEIVKEIVKPKVVDIPQPPAKKEVVPVVEAPKAVEPVLAEATKEPLNLDFDDSDLPW
jgi:PRTRC genetic system protein E